MDQRDSADDAVWAPPSRPRTGDSPLLDGYRDFTLIARGGDSVVYRAHQDAIDRDVAIKVVQLDDAESIARFGRELAITVRLGRQHPNIMTVLATGTTNQGQPCLVMDFVELGSLHDRLAERGPLPVSEVVAAGSVIADALAFAHAQGVLHRDVKPQNVLVLPTSYVLADFGLARAIDAGHSSSLERFSYRHASPQILDGETPTVADDVWSLGSTLFTLLDGRAPFASDDPDEDSALSYLRRARTEPPRTLDRADVPPQVAQIVQRCLSRERADRFPDAGALRDALDSVPTETRNWAPEPAVAQPPTSAAAAPTARAGPASAADPDAAFAPPPSAPPPPDVPPPVAAPPPVPAASSAPPPVAAAPAAPPPVAPSPVAASPVVAAPAAPPSAPAEVAFAPEPERPAVSALAQLPVDRPGASRDADATGLRPAEHQVEPPSGPPPARHQATPPSGDRRRWLLIAAAGVIALAVGIGVGVWRGSSGTATADHTPSSPVLDATTPPPARSTTPPARTTASGTGDATSMPPRRAAHPRITSYERQSATSVRLGWDDPGHGQDPFAVLEVVNGTPVAKVPQVPAGTTSVPVPDVPPGYHCFLIAMAYGGAASQGLQYGPVLCKTT